VESYYLFSASCIIRISFILPELEQSCSDQPLFWDADYYGNVPNLLCWNSPGTKTSANVKTVSFVKLWSRKWETMQGISNWKCPNLGSATYLLTVGKLLHRSQPSFPSLTIQRLVFNYPYPPTLTSTLNSPLYSNTIVNSQHVVNIYRLN
jgi:hypothetical protein